MILYNIVYGVSAVLRWYNMSGPWSGRKRRRSVFLILQEEQWGAICPVTKKYIHNRLNVKFLSVSNDPRYLNSDLAAFSYRYFWRVCRLFRGGGGGATFSVALTCTVHGPFKVKGKKKCGNCEKKMSCKLPSHFTYLWQTDSFRELCRKSYIIENDSSVWRPLVRPVVP